MKVANNLPLERNVKNFIHDDFLLENEYAVTLYHEYASKMPIIDYHCHLPPKDIAENRIFRNLTEIWINGDHYKWRAMRTLGIDEKNITGDASDFDKFKSWANTVPYTMRNPLFHWTHLELARYFDINVLLNSTTAEEVYHSTAEKLNTPEYSCQNLLSSMNVEVVCTTEDPIDDLAHHQALSKGNFQTTMSTCFRPDKSLLIEKEDYNSYIDQLETVVNNPIQSFEQLCDALKKRIAYFDENGCKLSDHGINNIDYIAFTASEVEAIFTKKRNKQTISELEITKFKCALLLYLAETYHEFGWVQQFHLGALRNNNNRMNRLLGPDTGWDSIGDFSQAASLSAFLDHLDNQDKLTKTILYNLNPADNEVLATMIGNFNDGKIKGKVQFGSGWWFLDQKDGMTKQLNALSNMGLISCFIGMLTDSRSFLSYPRHEYFRRLLCNLFGDEIKRGELPNDIPWIGKMIEDICYHNAKEYFNFNKK